jgi:hypothetical protein
VLEVEGEDREPAALGERHHARIDETEVEVGEASVDLGSTPNQTRGDEYKRMLAGNESSQEGVCCFRPDAGAE